MKISFYKMHGAANDFILVDDRAGNFPAADRSWLAAISHRRTGVGCEGVILIQPSPTADFRMRFFNPDGGEADMCGNGARCVARLARDLGIAPDAMGFETRAGRLTAEVLGDAVRLCMTEPRDWRMNLALDVEGRPWTAHHVNSGVPHAVLETRDLVDVDLTRLGPAIRHHTAFQPAGANVNFVQVADGNRVRVRTYERGVEGETLACGTGMVASALVLARLGRVTLPATVLPASGDALIVDAQPAGEGFAQVTLTGPAVHVFQGTLDYPPKAG